MVSGTALGGLGELLMTLWRLNCVVLGQAAALTQYHHEKEQYLNVLI